MTADKQPSEAIIQLSQDKETPLTTQVLPFGSALYLYSRSVDSINGNTVGQDYLVFKQGEHDLTFAVCDGVGQSFMGDLSARLLGDRLVPQQLHRSRAALFEFFGGAEGRAQPMHMKWHHLAYNEGTGVGMGEFSFWIGDADPSHGVIVVRVEDGLVTNWREYYYESELHWEEFTAANPF